VLWRFALVGGAIGASVAWQLAQGGRLPVPRVHLHAPRLDLLAAASPAIRLHLAAAVLALLVGCVLLIRRKGTAWHKFLGWGWVLAMGIVAGSSLFIQVLRPGQWSLLHLLSGWVLLALPFAVIAVRRGNVGAHRRTMTGIFIGGLLIAGLFTFAPGRLLFRVFLG
jgi:uncharacterized membrane protein